MTFSVSSYDLIRRRHILYAVFPKAGFYAPLLDEPVEFDLAYGCGNAYLFDYGDRHLATKGSQWRNGKPTVGPKRSVPATQ